MPSRRALCNRLAGLTAGRWLRAFLLAIVLTSACRSGTRNGDSPQDTGAPDSVTSEVGSPAGPDSVGDGVPGQEADLAPETVHSGGLCTPLGARCTSGPECCYYTGTTGGVQCVSGMCLASILP